MVTLPNWVDFLWCKTDIPRYVSRKVEVHVYIYPLREIGDHFFKRRLKERYHRDEWSQLLLPASCKSIFEAVISQEERKSVLTLDLWLWQIPSIVDKWLGTQAYIWIDTWAYSVIGEWSMPKLMLFKKVARWWPFTGLQAALGWHI